MSTTVDTPVLSIMQQVVNQNLLKYAAGHTLTCHKCGNILDCRRTVDITVWDGDKIGEHAVRCVTCYDRYCASAVAVARGRGVNVDVVDGRVVFGVPSPQAGQDPKLEPVRNPVRADEVEIGKVYWSTVSGRRQKVQITHMLRGRNGKRSWCGVNLASKRSVVIKSAARLRGVAD
jgi:hypothetical protein